MCVCERINSFRSKIFNLISHLMQGGVSEQVLQRIWIQVQPVLLCINSASRGNVNIPCKTGFILHFGAECVITW